MTETEPKDDEVYFDISAIPSATTVITVREAAIIEAIADLTRRVDMLAAKLFRLEMRDVDE